MYNNMQCIYYTLYVDGEAFSEKLWNIYVVVKRQKRNCAQGVQIILIYTYNLYTFTSIKGTVLIFQSQTEVVYEYIIILLTDF